MTDEEQIREAIARLPDGRDFRTLLELVPQVMAERAVADARIAAREAENAAQRVLISQLNTLLVIFKDNWPEAFEIIKQALDEVDATADPQG